MNDNLDMYIYSVNPVKIGFIAAGGAADYKVVECEKVTEGEYLVGLEIETVYATDIHGNRI